jgi:hypothetical protein
MKTIPFKPRAPETRTDVNVISWPMRRLTIDVPIDLHIRLKTGTSFIPSSGGFTRSQRNAVMCA